MSIYVSQKRTMKRPLGVPFSWTIVLYRLPSITVIADILQLLQHYDLDTARKVKTWDISKDF